MSIILGRGSAVMASDVSLFSYYEKWNYQKKDFFPTIFQIFSTYKFQAKTSENYPLKIFKMIFS
jgi:hypothetical protein